MRIFEITDFVDRAADIAKTGQPDRVVSLAEEIKQAGSAVVRRVRELLTSPAPAATAQPANNPASQPAKTTP
jgi:hypothetical protein